MSEQAGGTVIWALTAIALNRGASSEEVDNVWRRMESKAPTTIPSVLVAQVDAAIAEVRERARKRKA